MSQILIEKPKTRWQSWAKRIALRVFFPPVLLWDLAKLTANKLLGEKIGALVLPASTQYYDMSHPKNITKTAIAKRLSNETKQLQAEEVNIKTYDNAILDGVEFSYHHNDGTKSDEYIINFVGNSMCYEQTINDMVADAVDLKRNVIGFNYRGVGHSQKKGTSSNDLVTDGIAQVQRLLDQGVPAEKIFLKSHSLGGGISTLVAKHFHDHGLKVNLFNGRSFSSITNVVVGHIRTANSGNPELKNGHTETFGWKLLGWIAKPFIKFAVSLVKWEMEAGDAFKALPSTHKEYMLVRSSKERRQNINIKDDAVIPHYASIHAALKEERKDQKAAIDKLINEMDDAKSISLVAASNLETAKIPAQEARSTFKRRKMLADKPEMDGHVHNMDNLLDRHKNETASRFFRNFVIRAHNHHEKSKKPTGTALR